VVSQIPFCTSAGDRAPPWPEPQGFGDSKHPDVPR
jgi:hypothetical protein